METALALAADAAALIRATPHRGQIRDLELSVVLLRRIGSSPDGTGFVPWPAGG
jgi:hypothetical protein